ncbi:uncharacterized protein VNE69_05249 [Vairimorpha necatrix]|uniref:Uncharacterized protein n=1 Tax=Vairimorpha necatrix TaxID=6039 RepID=A0AAX4JCG4_9MICR
MQDKSIESNNGNMNVEEKVVDTTKYDGLKYIDEWISYNNNKVNSDSTIESSEYEEDTAFESLLDAYILEKNPYAESVKNLNKYIENKKLIDHEEPSNENDSIDLCNEHNLVDSECVDANSDYDELNINEKTQVTIHNNGYEDADRGEEIESRPFNILITKIDAPISCKKVFLKSYPDDSYYDNSSMPISTFGLISEAKTRTIQQNKRPDTNVPLRRFVIEKNPGLIHIKDILTFNDMKFKTVIGKVHKMCSKGYYTDNWISFKENLITVYKSKIQKKSKNIVMNESSGDLQHPEDFDAFLAKKYTIDIFQSPLYICKKKLKCKMFKFCSMPIPEDEDLVDISDKIITNIKETPNGYTMFLRKDSRSAEFELDSLHIAFKTCDGFHFFKFDSLTDYLKWNVIYKFRMSKIQLEIG